MFLNKWKTRCASAEAKLEVAESERNWYEHKYEMSNASLRAIVGMITTFESENTYGLAGYRNLVKRIKEKAYENVEKKLSDEIFGHFTSNSNKNV